MAKIGFSKLGLKIPNNTINIAYNEHFIEVKQYLPIENKLEIITKVIDLSTDDKLTFINPVKLKVYLGIEIIERYTNISLTEKQKENPTKLYDQFNSTGLLCKIYDAIPKSEYEQLLDGITESVKAFDAYRNSIMKILDSISSDYGRVDIDLDNIRDKITDPEAMALIKEMIEFSGLTNKDTNINEI